MSIGKRILSVVLSLAMILIALPIVSFATDPSDFAYDVISQQDMTAEISAYNGAGGDVVIPSVIDGYTITSIGDTAFGDDLNDTIVSLTIPATVEYVSPFAVAFLSVCEEYIVDANNQCYSTQDGVLYNYDKTELVRYPCAKAGTVFTVPSSVQTIGFVSFAFSALTEVILQNGLETIMDMAFAYSFDLQTIAMPNSVTYLGENTFDSCASLSDVTLSNGLDTINPYTFYRCLSLEELFIPTSITTIMYGAFEETSLLIVYGIAGSYAEAFASQNRYEFVPVVIAGDMDNDGVLDVNDIAGMMSFAVGNTTPDSGQVSRGDSNSDGVIDGFDVAYFDRLLTVSV